MYKKWGYHLIVDVSGCDIPSITSAENIEYFAYDLVQAIDMKAFGQPLIQDFANDDPGKGGYTLVQLIETSNICAHFVSATGDAYFDVFSCKPFEVDDALVVIEKYFKPKKWRVSMLERGAPYGD